MPKSEYTIPLMLTVKADDASQAWAIAEGLAEAYGHEGENIYAATPDAYDNDGQRVYYLPGEADAEYAKQQEPHLKAMREQPVHDDSIVNEPDGGWCSGCGEAGHTDEDHPPTEGHTSRQLSQAADDHEHCAERGQCWSASPTNACKLYGCHPCPTPGHQNEGRCNRCGGEA